jgi:hypothetical protein
MGVPVFGTREEDNKIQRNPRKWEVVSAAVYRNGSEAERHHTADWQRAENSVSCLGLSIPLMGKIAYSCRRSLVRKLYMRRKLPALVCTCCRRLSAKKQTLLRKYGTYSARNGKARGRGGSGAKPRAATRRCSRRDEVTMQCRCAASCGEVG